MVIYHGCDIQLFKGAELEIGAPCVMNNGVEIICMDRISIGSNCLISRGVVIRDNDGGHQVLIDGYKATAPVEIGNHVWIGQGAMILKGSKIGDNAIIGAGAIVQGRVKAGSLVMADPSRTFAKISTGHTNSSPRNRYAHRHKTQRRLYRLRCLSGLLPHIGDRLGNRYRRFLAGQSRPRQVYRLQSVPESVSAD